MHRLYNSGFEIEPRIVLISAFYPLPVFTEDLFVIIDFMAIYGHEFVSGMDNLHGDSGFKFSEVCARKQAVREAISKLVRQGFLEVVLADGFEYSVTDLGRKYAGSFESSYASLYRKNLSQIYDNYSQYTEEQLSRIIREKAVYDGKGDE